MPRYNKRIEWYPAGVSFDEEPLVLLDPARLSHQVMKGIGGFDLPNFSFASYATPGVDGVRFGGVTATRQAISVPVLVRASTRAEMRRLKSEMAVAMNPKRGPGRLVMSEDIGLSSGDRRFVEVMYRGGLEGSEASGGTDKWWQFTIQFEATDPYWYSTDLLRATWVGKPAADFFPFSFPLTLSDSGVDVDEVLDVTGDADTWPTFDMHGPFTRVRVRLDDDERQAFWEVQRNTSSTEMLRLVTKPGEESLTVFDVPFGIPIRRADSNAWSTLHPSSWFEPLRFQDQLVLYVDGTSEATRVELTALEAWHMSP